MVRRLIWGGWYATWFATLFFGGRFVWAILVSMGGWAPLGPALMDGFVACQTMIINAVATFALDAYEAYETDGDGEH